MIEAKNMDGKDFVTTDRYCGNCKFFKPDDEGSVSVTDDTFKPGETGICRRYPPILVQSFNELNNSDHSEEPEFWMQPIVLATGWCGEHQ